MAFLPYGRSGRDLDDVSSSTSSRHLMTISTNGHQRPGKHRSPADPLRLKRIEKLRSAISAGTYHVSAEQVAASMFRHAAQDER